MECFKSGFIKPIFFIFALCAHSNCNSQKQGIDTKNIDPTYLTEYEDMNKVNTKENIISTEVKDSTNQVFKINELSKDHISIIKLWATWCAPCIETMPEFQRLKEQYEWNKQIKFYTISLDHKFDHWLEMIRTRDWKVDHYYAGSNSKSQIYQLAYEVIEQMVTIALPNYVVLDRNGKLKENIITDGNAETVLNELLITISK